VYDAFGDLVTDRSYGVVGLGLGQIWLDNTDDPVGWGGQWGAYTDVTGGAPSPPSTPGGAWPGSAGLILLTHRYYNPDTGRFLTRDPMGYEGGVNVYAYTRNNPIMRIDPSGYDFLGLSDVEWRGAGKQLVNEFVNQIPFVASLRQMGLVSGDAIPLGRGESYGADRVRDNLSVLSVVSMQPEFQAFDFGEAIPAVSSKLVSKASKTPCFVAGTLVRMADGSSKSIEQVRIGDTVVSHKPQSEQAEVTQAMRIARNTPIDSSNLPFMETDSSRRIQVLHAKNGLCYALASNRMQKVQCRGINVMHASEPVVYSPSMANTPEQIGVDNFVRRDIRGYSHTLRNEGASLHHPPLEIREAPRQTRCVLGLIGTLLCVLICRLGNQSIFFTSGLCNEKE